MAFRQLPVFKGFTVDTRLRQFRRVRVQQIEFIDFDSEEGEKLLLEYIESLDKDSKEFKEVTKIF